MSKQDAKESVLKYLSLQNRPYSANDVTQNLHKEFGKTAIQKALDELASTGKIKEKVYGKQKVYSPLQEDCEQSELENALAQLDTMIKETTEDLGKVKQEIGSAEIELKTLLSQVSTESAKGTKTQLAIEIAKLREKLETLQMTTVKVEPEEKKKISQENEKLSKEYRKRKRICMDIANTILENYPKSKKVFFEEVGIETDEDVAR